MLAIGYMMELQNEQKNDKSNRTGRACFINIHIGLFVYIVDCVEDDVKLNKSTILLLVRVVEPLVEETK